jgi:hypothetical protein
MESAMNVANAVIKLAIAIGVGIVFALWSAKSLEAQGHVLHWNSHFAAALFFCLLSNAFGIARWKGLLTAQKVSLKPVDSALLSLTGDLFNTILPLGVAGDVVKSGLGSRLTRTSLEIWFRAWVADRFSGLLGLFLLSAVLWMGSEKSLWLAPFFLAAPLAAVVGLFVVGRIPKTATTKLPRLFQSMLSGARLGTHFSFRALTLSTSMAVLGHLSSIVAIVHIVQGLGMGLGVWDLLRAVSLGLVASSIPFLPGGMGAGNAGFEGALRWFGLTGGGLVYSLYAVHFIFVGALGVLSCALLLKRIRLKWSDIFFGPHALVERS